MLGIAEVLVRGVFIMVIAAASAVIQLGMLLGRSLFGSE